MSANICPNCNALVQDHDRFCEECGCFLEHPTAAPVAESAQPNAAASAPAAQPAPAATEAAGSPYAKAVGQASAGQSGQETPQGWPPVADAVPDSGEPWRQETNSQATYAQPGYAAPDYAQPAYAAPSAPFYADSGYAVEAAPAAAFGLAITSMVMGILGLLSFGIMFFLGFVGIILGIVALALRSGYKKRGLYDAHAGSTLGMGIAGIIMNVLAIVMIVTLIGIGVMLEDETGYTDVWDDYGIEEILDEIDT